MSLDVIYHLLEDNIFDSYMKNLFNSSNKFVCIYSSNIDIGWDKHVKHRKFTDWIEKNEIDNWRLIEYIPNKYLFDPKKIGTTTLADFYFYEKIKCKFSILNICIF